MRVPAGKEDRLRFVGNIIETGTVSFRLAYAYAYAQRTAAR